MEKAESECTSGSVYSKRERLARSDSAQCPPGMQGRLRARQSIVESHLFNRSRPTPTGEKGRGVMVGRSQAQVPEAPHAPRLELLWPRQPDSAALGWDRHVGASAGHFGQPEGPWGEGPGLRTGLSSLVLLGAVRVHRDVSDPVLTTQSPAVPASSAATCGLGAPFGQMRA